MSLMDALPVQSNRKARLLLTLIVDTSGSMNSSGGINELNTALHDWRPQLTRDDFLSSAGEIAMISFGHEGVMVIDPSGRTDGRPAQAYVPINAFNPPALRAAGLTPMVEAIQEAMVVMAARRDQLRAEGVQMAYRPLLYLVTDGVPTDPNGQRTDRWRDLAPVLRQHETGKHLLFFAMGVRGADRAVLQGLAPQSHYMLDNLNFTEVLQMVSTSIDTVHGSGRDNDTATEIYGKVNEVIDANRRMRDWLEGS
jgi:uncharacterized protein YegL